MNLHTLKRGFGRTNPEKGLHHLVGAQKSDRHEDQPATIRIKGVYISPHHKTPGRILGALALGLAWISASLLICGLTLSFLPIAWRIPLADYTITTYVATAILMHVLVFIADGITYSNAPLARKSIIVFWGSLALYLAIYLPVIILKSFL